MPGVSRSYQAIVVVGLPHRRKASTSMARRSPTRQQHFYMLFCSQAKHSMTLCQPCVIHCPFLSEVSCIGQSALQSLKLRRVAGCWPACWSDISDAIATSHVRGALTVSKDPTEQPARVPLAHRRILALLDIPIWNSSSCAIRLLCLQLSPWRASQRIHTRPSERDV